jgi:hypothetical protein
MFAVDVSNKMSKDIYIEEFSTDGSVVFNSIPLVGQAIKSNSSASIQVGFTTPSCNSESNFVTLSLFDENSGDCVPLFISWGDNGVRVVDGKYVVGGLCRITQEGSRSGINFTFYDDSPGIVELLIAKARSRIAYNAQCQQRQRTSELILFSGLLENEFN